MLRAVVVASLIAVPFIAIAAGQRVAISGEYKSNYDDVKLYQDGDLITGTYVCCGGGTIEGRLIENRIVRYRWKQPNATGMGVWQVNGDKLSGTWGVNQDDKSGGRWDLVRSSQIAH